MNTNDSRTASPMAEPGRRPTGRETGGIAQSADGGLADALQRSSEHADDDVVDAAQGGEVGRAAPDVARAPVGAGSGAPLPSSRSAAAQGHGNAHTTHPAQGFEDDDEAAVPKALSDADEPRNESAAESLGRSISEVLTGATHENKVEGTTQR